MIDETENKNLLETDTIKEAVVRKCANCGAEIRPYDTVRCEDCEQSICPNCFWCCDDCRNPGTTTLSDLHTAFRKWIYYDDTTALDVVLAVAASQRTKKKGEPLWLIYVAPTGGSKTEKIKALDDGGENAYMLHRLTPKTLVSGKKDAGDLAPKLDGKLVLIPDFASILQMRTEDKAELWAQLRDLYDGYAGLDSGSGKSVKYKDLRVTFIACTTTAIDSQILVHQALGTRELFYRDTEDLDLKELTERVSLNLGQEDAMRAELREKTQSFLQGIKELPTETSPKAEMAIRQLSIDLAQLRAIVPSDGYSGDIIGLPAIERPTRILKQLKQLFLALKGLDRRYTDKRALDCLRKVAASSVDPLRLKIVKTMNKRVGEKLVVAVYSVSALAKALKVSWKPIKTRLNELYALDLVERTEENSAEGAKYMLTDKGKAIVDNLYLRDLPIN